MQTIVERIQQMEQYYEEVSNAIEHHFNSFSENEEIREKLQKLAEYQKSGKWLKDYEADERGELPVDLKRGVLSQDGLYALLCNAEKYMCNRKESNMHFYYTRHGQTVWNVENKICGATDSPLTDKGKAQARELGEKIKAEGYKIDEILYSPLSRARDTALIVSELTGIPARAEIRLTEQNFGKWEGTPRNGADFQADKQNFVTSFEGGESMLRLAQRIYNLIDEIKGQDKIYLLVAHNGISRVMESYFHEMTNEEYAAFGIRNCEIKKYIF
ncbi:MAG: DUF4298 domain-containing protein [Lachnospiraceae bacterium]|nr:DUF4298 domain-containing protein [Lachnospiraceae bacterium]